MSVTLKKSAKTGLVINNYANSTNGYVNVVSEDIVIRGSWIGSQKRSALLKGDVGLLEKLIKAVQKPDGTLPGKIIVLEYSEHDVPASVAAEFIRTDVDYEEAIASYVKRAGNDGIEMEDSNGDRILRFQKYIMNPTDADVDVIVEHANAAQVKEDAKRRNAEAKAKAAELVEEPAAE